MMSWRTKIVDQLTSEVDRVVIASDPDSLLLEEVIAEDLYTHGFEVISYADPVSFRFEYESRYRALWDRGEQPERSVIIRTELADGESLPFDILKAGRHVSISLGELFPKLSYPVVASLDRGLLDALYKAQVQRTPDILGENETKDFVLRYVFGVDPDLIQRISDLLLLLLRLHFRKVDLPHSFRSRLLDILTRDEVFREWPLMTLLTDRLDFFGFLQERWPIFLDHLTAGSIPSSVSTVGPSGFRYKGPANLPFDDPDVRAFVDTLFYEGLLHPIEYPMARELSASWAIVGIKTDPEADRKRRFEGLTREIYKSIPREDAGYRDWLNFAQLWAELITLRFEIAPEVQNDIESRFLNLQGEIDDAFLKWILKRYGGLHNHASATPVMVHHLPRFMARQLESSQENKVAVIVVDGMAVDQWIVLRNVLQQQSSLRFREDAMFAWSPTLTSVSRQALFAGRPPVYFPESINTTDDERALWNQFWADQGFSQRQVIYVKSLRDEANLTEVEEFLSLPQVRVAGLVVDKVDRIMHGMELGKEGMHGQVRLWAMKGFMVKLLGLLLDSGFEVYITADHGNVHATGIGRPDEGSLAEYRGERVRIFNDEGLRERVKTKFPGSIGWPSAALPDNYLPLLAPGRSAFITVGESRVVHGSISLEELIVPLIYVSREV